MRPGQPVREGFEAFKVSAVSKVYSQRDREVHALDNVDLALPPHEFVCLLGPSGCGKSTLLRLAAGLERPTTGEVTVLGQSPELARKARRIGLVFQEGVLLPWRTVEENIALPLEIARTQKAKRKTIVAELGALVGLDQFMHSFPHELSGGMQQRVGIARALSHDPPLLLMDEPFGALDAITRDRMNFELLRIWEQKRKTILFVTHSIGEAALLSDRVVVMAAHPGRIRAVLENPLPRPRTTAMRDEPQFAAFTRQLRRLLEDEDA